MDFYYNYRKILDIYLRSNVLSVCLTFKTVYVLFHHLERNFFLEKFIVRGSESCPINFNGQISKNIPPLVFWYPSWIGRLWLLHFTIEEDFSPFPKSIYIKQLRVGNSLGAILCPGLQAGNLMKLRIYQLFKKLIKKISIFLNNFYIYFKIMLLFLFFYNSHEAVFPKVSWSKNK